MIVRLDRRGLVRRVGLRRREWLGGWDLVWVCWEVDELCMHSEDGNGSTV